MLSAMLLGTLCGRIVRIGGRLMMLALFLCCMGAACGETALAIMPGVINDPGNRSLRREIFSFGTKQLCSEMQKRSIPLKLRDEDPSIGRFFPTACQVKELENENLFVQFIGHGYAWTNVTGRMGFEASAAIEYEHDFLMDGSTMYVYFKQKETKSTAFRVQMVERTQAGTTPSSVAGLFGTTVQQASQRIGERVVEHQLARGFTVVRDSDGAVSFALGVLEKGERPSAPFARGDSDWLVLANDRSELHNGQRDFAGPFEIADQGDALHVTVHLEGAPSVDVLVMPKALGDQWLQTYEREAATTPPPGAVMIDETLQAAAPGPPGTPPPVWKRAIRAPKGLYYVVFDHTATAGATAPPTQGQDDRAALVSYAVQLEE